MSSANCVGGTASKSTNAMFGIEFELPAIQTSSRVYGKRFQGLRKTSDPGYENSWPLGPKDIQKPEHWPIFELLENTNKFRILPITSPRTVEELRACLFEFLINRNLKAGGQAIGHIGRTNNAHQLAELSVCHPLRGRSGAVGRDAVLATIRHSDCDINQFADKRIEFTQSPHYLFEHRPRPLKCRWMIGDRFPEVVDFVRLPRGPDVIVNLADQPAALFVFDE